MLMAAASENFDLAARIAEGEGAKSPAIPPQAPRRPGWWRRITQPLRDRIAVIRDAAAAVKAARREMNRQFIEYSKIIGFQRQERLKLEARLNARDREHYDLLNDAFFMLKGWPEPECQDLVKKIDAALEAMAPRIAKRQALAQKIGRQKVQERT